MKKSILTTAVALALAGSLAACGGGQDGEDSATSSEGMVDTGLPDAAVRTEEAVGEAADAMEDAAETAGEEMERAADQVSEMAGDAAQEAEQMASDAADEAEEMVSEAGQDAEQMVNEAREEAEAAAAGAAGAMGMDDGDSAAEAASGDPCVVDVGVGDSIAYTVDSISVPSSCESVTINLEHTGSLPKEAMGHNWVLVPADAINAIGNAGMTAGADADYVPDDDRIVAATGVIGGGESTSVTFSLSELEDGVDYAYVCTFPGHWSVMQGPFTVE